ncbi:hypothetical protein PoB_007643600 [Plakobranchus ocellatus]|uniref:Uncharacterized protein n=1 Tax=Plakobranchus ocellatus TaxID=259542 RepID=A0AAV4E1J6_9GAST|nr:hypothetical protein PoB_007643600 [Plakobranchus ocellatus]
MMTGGAIEPETESLDRLHSECADPSAYILICKNTLFKTSRQLKLKQSYLRLSGPPSDRGAGGEARTRDRRVPAGFRADPLVTVPPTPRRKSRCTQSCYRNS